MTDEPPPASYPHFGKTSEVLFNEAAEGLDADEKEILHGVVENLTNGVHGLLDLRGPAYAAAFLLSMGERFADFARRHAVDPEARL